MEWMMGNLFLKALVLCGILFWIARHEADFEFKKVVLVTCGIALGDLALEAFIFPKLAVFPFVVSALLGYLILLAFVTFMVVRFCWVRPGKGVLVAFLFIVFGMGVNLIGVLVAKKFGPSSERARTTEMGQNSEESSQILRDIMGMPLSREVRTAETENAGPVAETPRTDTMATLLSGAEAADGVPQGKTEPEPPEEELPAFARTPEWQAAQAKIKVSAVLMEQDGSNVAIVNGNVLGIGDTLTIEMKKKLYRFKLAEITTDWVAWDPLGEMDAN